jgi:imidazolonepropionase-like amidohydrolase
MKNLLITAFLFSFLAANGNVPAKAQSAPILLKGGTVYTVTGNVLQNTDVLFEKGKITAIGTNLNLPANTVTIDVSGKHVYPGLISPLSTLGIREVDAVRSTNDQREVGNYTPEVNAQTAYNADSELIPTVRSNGVTYAVIVPQGGRVSGQSSLMQLDAWNSEDAVVANAVALHINWPNMTIYERSNQPVAKQEEAIAKQLAELRQFFVDAQNYAKRSDKTAVDVRLESMQAALEGKAKVVISAHRFDQLRSAIQFIDEFKLSAVFEGADDALLVKDLLKERNIPLILSKTQRLPNSADSNYDEPFAFPAQLAEAGITFCFSIEGNWNNFNLPFQAGQAVAFGLSKKDALAALTINTATVYGLEKQIGSIEVGKAATLVVSEGDIMDMMTNKVVLEFIDGRNVDLNNRHKMLYEKYKQKGE